MNIFEIIKKAPKDHVYWCTLYGEVTVSMYDSETHPIELDEVSVILTHEGCFTLTGGECILFPSKDNRDWKAFERELDEKVEEEKEPDLVPIISSMFPRNHKFYCLLLGECTVEIENMPEYSILCINDRTSQILSNRGSVHAEYGECVLFPSKEERSWDKYLNMKKDLPRGTKVMSTNSQNNDYWSLGYYTGNGTCTPKKGELSKCDPDYMITWLYVVPVEKFDFETLSFRPEDNYGREGKAFVPKQ